MLEKIFGVFTKMSEAHDSRAIAASQKIGAQKSKWLTDEI